jgi:hypothetical protein
MEWFIRSNEEAWAREQKLSSEAKQRAQPPFVGQAGTEKMMRNRLDGATGASDIDPDNFSIEVELTSVGPVVAI